MGNKFAVKKGSKFKNRFVRIDGILFHSQKEAKWWIFLQNRQKAGEISGLERQVRFEIYRTKEGKPRHYIADFVFWEDGKERVVDVKSNFTAKDPVFKIKKELFECKYTKNLEIWTTQPPKSIVIGPEGHPEQSPEEQSSTKTSQTKKSSSKRKSAQKSPDTQSSKPLPEQQTDE